MVPVGTGVGNGAGPELGRKVRDDMRTILHVGVHRTGTTSVQAFLRQHLGAPAYPIGTIQPDLHLETAVVALRDERLGPAGRTRRPECHRTIEGWVAEAVAAGTDLVLSSEELSFVRHPDERDRILDLLEASGAVNPEVVFVRRGADAFLTSYRTVAFIIGRSDLAEIVPPPSPDEQVADSWLVDFDSRIDIWAARCRVHVIDYEAELAARASIIPAIADLVGVAPAEFWLNSSADVRAVIEAALREKAAEKARRRGQ